MALVAFAVELNPITVAFVVEVSVILLSLPKVGYCFQPLYYLNQIQKLNLYLYQLLVLL